MSEQTMAVLLFAAGAIASVLLPYLREWVDSREAFDWRKVVGQILTVGITIASQLLGVVDALGDANGAQAFVLGWGVSSMGRMGQKVYDRVKE